jgi:hypothetical protein
MQAWQEKISLIDKINACGGDSNEIESYIQWAHNLIRTV